MAPEVRQFWQHMAAIAEAGNVPHYADLDLMDIHRLAPNILVLDVEAYSGRLRVRFVGTAIVRMFGYETTGRYMDEVDTGPYQMKLMAAYNLAVRSLMPQWTLAEVILTDSTIPYLEEQKGFAYERLACPFHGPTGAVTQLVAILKRHQSDVARDNFKHRSFDWSGQIASKE